MKKFLALILLFVASWSYSQGPKKADNVIIDGKNVYYEVYGEGEPLFLLHGYTGSSKYWIPYVSYFQEEFEVYVVDLQGHGKSDVFDKDWSIRSVAENLNGLIEYLEIDEMKGIGFSYGGDILFQLATLNPTLVKSMVTIGALGSWDIKDFPDWEQRFQYSNLENLKWIKNYQIDDQHIKSMLDLFKNYQVYLTDDELKKIEADVLLVLGDDDDSIPLEEVDRVRKNLPSSDLWILPNSAHGAHKRNLEEFIRITKSFLKDE
ncbi:MAG: alpha/beta fold hydrolase [Bacteroidota bacterium]